jgi:glycine/D-amino acid oxidase-like deaminating enzyme
MGSLNEKNPSLWVGTSEATRFHELHGDLSADVVVIGAGIAGLTTAALLKADGRRVVVVDAGRVAAGVTGYTTAKLTVLHGLIFDDLTQAFGQEGARKYADANLAGMAAVAELAVRHEIDCDLERRPAYTYTTDPSMVDKVSAEVSAAQELGLSAEFTTETDLPYPIEGAIRVADQAQFHARKYCIGQGAVYRRRGRAVHG